MKEATDWQAGKEYTYTVSLAAAKDPGYTVSEDGKTYEVYNAEGLKNIAKLVNEEWKSDINITLTADIDLSGIDWTPIGIDYNHQYTGTFNGGGLEGVQITTTHSEGNAGGVAGYSRGNIENCSVSGSVSGSGTISFVGGVVGYQWDGSLTGCSSSATVNAGNIAGGVAGSTYSATLTACYATGDVTLESSGSGTYYAGGVVGDNSNRSTVIACYAWGSVSGSGSGTIYVGGVTGSNTEGTLTACYHANGTVSSPDGTTGGVAGRN